MKKSETKMNYKNSMTMTRRLAACCLLLFALAGSTFAQGNDKLFVIKRTKYDSSVGDHYLAHVKEGDNWVLQDATEFSPNCLWYSGREFNLMGTHHNYYFVDDEHEYRFLSAPLASGGALAISDSKPEVYLLNNTDQNYYFYDWDADNGSDGAGLARGHQYYGVTNRTDCEACEGGKWDEDDEECWAVYWVECNGTTWSLSTVSQYNITDNSGRFRYVTDTLKPMQITSTTGGLDDLTSFEMDYQDSEILSASITAPFNYIPAYHKYDFNEVTVPAVPANPNANPPTPAVPATIVSHTYYYPHGSSNSNPPAETFSGNNPNVTYNWSISGAGAEYLTLTDGNTATPTLTYNIENNTGHKTATLTLTVTYQDGSTQTKTATVTVKTPCQNPAFSANVTYEGVIVSWTPTAESYTVSWKKTDASEWYSHQVNNGDVTSDTITGLEYETTYDYKVQASCDPTPATSEQFTTLNQPKAVIGGAVFGGGRMANVGGKTEVVIINTDSIGAVYGGNDIAGEVLGTDGSTIKLGVTSDDPDAGTYNNGAASTKVRIGDVYGGGNGYYAYDGSSFEPADDDHTTFEVPNGGTVKAMTQSHQLGEVVWTNTTGNTYTMVVPKITKTNITMANNAVKVDSIFGGAKNAFITNTDADANGTSITVNGGTAFAVFGGNNFGGNQTAGKHHIEVNNTKSNSTVYPDGLGRNYGIGYVFGGGNKVVGLTTDITISGGMCDTVFAGGNAADVGDANVVVNCPQSKTFTNAVSTWDEDGNITGINEGYAWNGTGIYNVRALFGGNNRDHMHNLPTITLTRGSVGTVYGGGNSGRMLAQTPETSDKPIATEFGANYIGNDELPIYYGTHVIMNSPNMLVDYLYGGCQMSDVLYSTWVEVLDGHVGTVYGGCNIGGDVGSTRLSFNIPDDDLTNEHKQAVQGATYVKASGGTIYGDLYAGSNGYYHCNDGVHYVAGLDFSDQYHVGRTIPSHNETHVKVSKDEVTNTFVTVKGNVYAGGNMAYVGFINATTNGNNYPTFRGFCTVQMDGGVVEGSVYGGGNRASVFGSNAVQVSGGSIGYIGDELTEGGALYGGNDKAGQVAQITNRVLPDSYSVASDGATNLKIMGVKTYVGITGNPQINTVYGGGNGAYTYTEDEYCDVTDKPVQSNTFVDVNIDADGGAASGGYINMVYGGGNGVTVLDRITVFVNVKNTPTGENAYDQVGTIFGGNNKGNLDILSDIILLHGQVNTVYGGCNEGAMTGSLSYNEYDNLGSMVHLRSQYQPNGTGTEVTPDAKVTGYVYGGCRSNGVSNNTLVLVDGGEHPATFFGGSDISGIVGGTSQVIVTGGSTGTVFGGGNGNYYYANNNVYDANDHSVLIAEGTAEHPIQPPYCNYTHVEALGGTCTNNVFGGGYAGECGETYILVNGGSVTNTVFGGGNQAGVTIVDMNPDPEVAENTTGNSTVNMYNGFVGLGVYGGCNAQGGIEGDVEMNFRGGTIGTNSQKAEIHGGGFGQPTTVAGNVLINFGQTMWDESGETPVEIHDENLNLYGDLYGGSALGNVNTDDDNTTTIHIDNGTIHGNTYGGGLGDKASLGAGHTDVEAKVFGKVYVIVGGTDGAATPTFFGKASFDNGSIFGCNNLNGSPQANVFVDVYQTNHTAKDVVDYTASDRTYAIDQLFGGGNEADYAPENGYASSTCSTNVYIHGCENTIEDVFGGSNAADSNSASTVVEGGRFNFIFGGGNGVVSAANVGTDPAYHNTYSRIEGGRVGWCFGGSNRQGNCINIEQDLQAEGSCGELIIDYFFQGGNQADQYGEMLLTLDCSEAKKYLSAYGGCRLGTVYGNITVIMTGGTIGSLFGGSQGNEDYPAHVKRFPTEEELTNHPEAYSQELKDFINTQLALGKDWRGEGGNITVIVKGGAVGNLYGGCDTKGNVDGKITVIVESEENSCGLFVGNIYGASNHTEYIPEHSDGISPKVNVIKATVGGSYDFNETPGIQQEEIFEGNVFGGGNEGVVESNPKVIIGDGTTNKPVTIKGSVYGGGNYGNVVGNPQVLVDPDTHNLSVASEHGTVTVGSNAPSPSYTVGEDVDINIVATAAPLYAFSHWEVTGEGASVGKTTLANTTFTMGTENATLTAYYAPAKKLTIVADPPAGGTFRVNGVVYTEPIYVAPETSVTVVASPAAGYNFAGWTVTGTGSSVTDATLTTTHFTMGSEDATLTATFTEGRAYNDMNSNR